MGEYEKGVGTDGRTNFFFPDKSRVFQFEQVRSYLFSVGEPLMVFSTIY